MKKERKANKRQGGLMSLLVYVLCVALVCGSVLTAYATDEDAAETIAVQTEEGTQDHTETETVEEIGDPDPDGGQKEETTDPVVTDNHQTENGTDTDATDTVTVEEEAPEEEVDEEIEEADEEEIGEEVFIEEEPAEEPDEVTIDGVDYALDKENGTASVTGGVSTASLCLPAEIKTEQGNTYRVTTVADDAFKGVYVGSLTIADGGIERIGQYAFYNSNIKGTLHIPDTVEYINYYAFAACSIDHVIYGSGIRNISYATFMSNRVPLHVEFNLDTLQYIDKYAMYNTELSGVTIHGTNAANYASLQSRLQDNDAFRDADIVYTELDLGDASFVTVGNGTYKIESGEATLIEFKGVYSRFAIPSHVEDGENSYPVTEIGDDAFTFPGGGRISYAPELPDTITRIGKRAMKDVEAFTWNNQLIIPDSVRVIDEEAFRNGEFTEIFIGKGVNRIESGAFAGISGDGYFASAGVEKVMKVTFYATGNLTYIAPDAFAGALIQTVSVYGAKGSMDALFETVPELKKLMETGSVHYYDYNDEDHRNVKNTFYATTEDGVVVTVEVGSPKNLPDDVELVVTKVTPECTGYAYDAYMAAMNQHKNWLIADGSVAFSDANTLLYDIAFIGSQMDENGMRIDGEKTECQPGTVSVSMNFNAGKQLSNDLRIETKEDILVMHLPVREELKAAPYSTAALTGIGASDIVTERINQGSNSVSFGSVTADYLNFNLDSLSLVAISGRKAVSAEVDSGRLQEMIDETKQGSVAIGNSLSVEETIVIRDGYDITLTDDGKAVNIVSDCGKKPLFIIEQGAKLTIDGDLCLIGAQEGAQITLFDVKGSLTLKDGTLNGGLVTGDNAGAVVLEKGSGATFTMTGGALENTKIDGWKFRNASAPVVVQAGTSFDMTGGVIRDNFSEARGYDNGGYHYSESSGGVVVYGGEAHIGGSALFTGNQAVNGGAMFIARSGKVTIDGGRFENNTAGDGGVGGMGGAIAVVDDTNGRGIETELVMTGGVFSGNRAATHGGAIYVHSNGVYLKGGVIENNSANGYGGGVYVSCIPKTLHLNHVIVSGNTADNQGGGVWLCPTGAGKFIALNGIAIYNNAAGGAGDDFVSNSTFDKRKDMEVHLDRRMLGFGPVAYYNDGGMKPGAGDLQATDAAAGRFDPANPGKVVDTSGTHESLALKAVTTSDAIAAAEQNASLIIRDNSAYNGGGIGSNGNTEIPGVTPTYFTLNVEKVWEVDSNTEILSEVRVRLYLDGVGMETVTLNEESGWKGSFANILDYDKQNGHLEVKEVDANGNPVEEGGLLNGTYLVHYGDLVEDGQTLTITITNKKPDEPDEPEEPDNPPPPPETPEEPETPDNPPPTTPETPAEPPQVLGVRRTDGEAVLGARRGKTGEQRRAEGTMLLAAAALGLVTLIRGKKKAH